MLGIPSKYDMSTPHVNQGLQAPGALIGTGIGAYFGGPIGAKLGGMAGQNAGQTIGDLAGGNIKGLGLDMSQNLPPGMQAPGWGGILNTATGLPLARWFGLGG